MAPTLRGTSSRGAGRLAAFRQTFTDHFARAAPSDCHLPKGEPVLSIAAKTGRPALSRRLPLQMAAPRRAARCALEYQPNGTRCLFACFNVVTGKVLGRCTTQRKRVDFLSFMDQVASVYRQRRVHVIWDNLNTHRDTNQGAFITEWNKRHGRRFVFHYTPTHGSWLNQVELWF